MKKYDKFIGFTCSEGLLSDLEDLCAAHRITKSKAIRIAVEMYLESMKGVVPVLRKKDSDAE